tara:strand:- start:558 stop:740 length:183 start_codon:yes stop_codon:yes gene_type:complete
MAVMGVDLGNIFAHFHSAKDNPYPLAIVDHRKILESPSLRSVPGEYLKADYLGPNCLAVI